MKYIFNLVLILSIWNTFVFAQEPIKVVSTIGQITDIVRIIGGEQVNVKGLMGSGVDPHLYKASESDVRKLSEAKIIFYNGLFLEAKMEYIFAKMSRNKLTVALGESIDKSLLLESIDYAGHYDPHIWFNVPFWKQVAKKITTVLSEFDPSNANLYQERFARYAIKLDALHALIRKRSEEISKRQRVLVTAHDAFRYFGQEYDFEVLGLQGISTESQAGIADVRNLAEFIVDRKIKAIFVESSVSERNIKAVQQAVKAKGWNVEIGGELFSDALGEEGTFEGTYIGMVTHNINTIVDALKD